MSGMHASKKIEDLSPIPGSVFKPKNSSSLKTTLKQKNSRNMSSRADFQSPIPADRSRTDRRTSSYFTFDPKHGLQPTSYCDNSKESNKSETDCPVDRTRTNRRTSSYFTYNPQHGLQPQASCPDTFTPYNSDDESPFDGSKTIRRGQLQPPPPISTLTPQCECGFSEDCNRCEGTGTYDIHQYYDSESEDENRQVHPLTSTGSFTTCYGCEHGKADQFSHMEKGGCLYDHDEDLDFLSDDDEDTETIAATHVTENSLQESLDDEEILLPCKENPWNELPAVSMSCTWDEHIDNHENGIYLPVQFNLDKETQTTAENVLKMFKNGPTFQYSDMGATVEVLTSTAEFIFKKLVVKAATPIFEPYDRIPSRPSHNERDDAHQAAYLLWDEQFDIDLLCSESVELKDIEFAGFNTEEEVQFFKTNLKRIGSIFN
jgi:hypothetical protein